MMDLRDRRRDRASFAWRLLVTPGAGEWSAPAARLAVPPLSRSADVQTGAPDGLFNPKNLNGYSNGGFTRLHSKAPHFFAFQRARSSPTHNPRCTTRLYPDLSMLASVAAAMPPGVAASCSKSSNEMVPLRHARIPSARAWAAAVKAVLRSSPSISAASASTASAWYPWLEE